MEFQAPPTDSWPQGHVHAADEAWYVLEGEVSFRIGDRTLVGRPGSFVLAPGGTPHATTNLGADSARYLVVFSPGGLEAWFRELASLIEGDPTAVSSSGFEELAARHGITFLSDPAPDSA